MEEGHETHNILGTPDLIHGLELDKLSWPILWEVTGFSPNQTNLFYFTAAFLFYLFISLF